MQLSDSNLEIIRRRPHQTKLDLFVFQPRIVMQCLVNDVGISKGAREIEYDTVSTGTFGEVESGMTLLIGKTAGGDDVGRIRIRSTTSSTFVVSENSNIKWEDDLHLTVLRYFELWPVFPFIDHDPANQTDIIFYKDYDIPHTTENFILGTFVNAGMHRPVLLE